MAGVSVLLTLNGGACSEARLVYLNAGDRPFEAGRAQGILQGQSLDDTTIEAAASEAAQEVDPLGNVHASVEYQRHLVKVLTRRALKKAFERAMNNSQ
jgi:carbon-monoxide dehydrogenase medium subunit